MDPKGPKNLKVLQKKSKYQKRKSALDQKDDINEASEPEIYLDMDGVLVDFFNEWAKLVGVKNWRDIKNVEKSFDLIKQQKNWWANLPTLPSAKAILGKIKEVKGQYKILSSPLAQDPDSVPGKKEWIKKNLSGFSPADVILTHNKSKYAKKADGTPNILIDDFGKNIKGWESAGGIGIKHENNAPNLTLKKLESVFKKKVNEETLPTNIVDSNIRKLGDIFDDAGFEVRIVGGAVRDIALGKEPKDIDFATDATPDEMIAMLDKAGVKHIPTGIEHGTITAVLNGEPFEITTLRADTETDGRKAKVDFIRNWKEDALRRDLTYNAMSMDIDGNLYDYFDGMDDLQNKVSKFVGDPAERIKEDYLRILRYFRFQSRLDSPKWDKETLKAIKINSKGLAGISVERIWQEISKLLVGSSAYETLRYMETTGINKIIGLNNSVEKLKGTNYDNPIMALSTIVNDIQIAKQWKLSNAETAELDFYTSYKDTKFDSKKVRDMIVDGANKEYLKNVLVMQNENSLAKEVDTFTAPEFPVTGKDLLDKGLKSGPDLGKALANLKARWMDSNYELTKDQLLSNINEDFIDSIKRFIDVKTHPKNYSKAADVLHKLLQRKKRESKGKLRHSPEYYAQQIARTVNGIDGRALYRNYLKTYGDQVVEGIMLKLERDYDADMLILHVKDTKTDKRTEVRGKLGYEVGGYDKDDKLHKLLDKIGKTANISDMMNGDIVHINPNHPKGPEAIKTATKIANEDKDFNELNYVLKKEVPKDKAVMLTRLGKFHDGADELEDYVPERKGKQYALHPNNWKGTYYSLTNKDTKKINFYKPKIVTPAKGSMVADMAIANKFYRTKDEAEKKAIAQEYKNSMVPYGSDISKIKFPEILMPGIANEYIVHEGRDADLYHVTDDTGIMGILSSGSIKPKNIYTDREAGEEAEIGPRISLTRDFDFDLGEFKLIIDQRKLSQTHKITPFTPEEMRDEVENEAEEYVQKPIPIDYIKAIHLEFDDDATDELKQLAKRAGIPLVTGDKRNPEIIENFADGKKKGKSRPGRVKRAGASCKGSVTDLRRKAKNSSGERAKMYHWCANMKSGRKKKKK